MAKSGKTCHSKVFGLFSPLWGASVGFYMRLNHTQVSQCPSHSYNKPPCDQDGLCPLIFSLEVHTLLQSSTFQFSRVFSFLTTRISNVSLGMYTQQVFKDTADKSIQKGESLHPKSFNNLSFKKWLKIKYNIATRWDKDRRKVKASPRSTPFWRASASPASHQLQGSTYSTWVFGTSDASQLFVFAVSLLLADISFKKKLILKSGVHSLYASYLSGKTS